MSLGAVREFILKDNLGRVTAATRLQRHVMLLLLEEVKQLRLQDSGAADGAVSTTLYSGGDLEGRLHYAVELSDIQAKPRRTGRGLMLVLLLAKYTSNKGRRATERPNKLNADPSLIGGGQRLEREIRSAEGRGGSSKNRKVTGKHERYAPENKREYCNRRGRRAFSRRKTKRKMLDRTYAQCGLQGKTTMPT